MTARSARPVRRYRQSGDYQAWCRREKENAALAAEAQRAWEEKAQADAAEWAKRAEAEGSLEETKP